MIMSLLLAASAPPTPPPVSTNEPPPAVQQQAQPAPEAERVVCRTVRITGSRLGGQRVCRTISQQAESSDRARDAAREMQRDSGGLVDRSGPGR